MEEMADLANDSILDELEEWELDRPPEPEDGYPMYHPWYGDGTQRKPSGPGPYPICGSATKEADGKFGKFYGCLDFPYCNGSRNYKRRQKK